MKSALDVNWKHWCYSWTSNTFGHLMWRADSFEKILTLGNIEDRSRGGTEDKMIGWHHLLNAHEVEQAPGIGDGKGSLVCCSQWGCKESNTTEQLNWTELKFTCWSLNLHCSYKLPELWETNLCCLSHPVSGILLWQPKLTNTTW